MKRNTSPRKHYKALYLDAAARANRQQDRANYFLRELTRLRAIMGAKGELVLAEASSKSYGDIVLPLLEFECAKAFFGTNLRFSRDPEEDICGFANYSFRGRKVLPVAG